MSGSPFIAPMHHGVAVEDGRVFAWQQQDPEPVLANVNALRDQGRLGAKDFRHAAEIPVVLVEKYCAEHGVTFEEWMQNKAHIRRMVNDPDNKPFRVWQGRI